MILYPDCTTPVAATPTADHRPSSSSALANGGPASSNYVHQSFCCTGGDYWPSLANDLLFVDDSWFAIQHNDILMADLPGDNNNHPPTTTADDKAACALTPTAYHQGQEQSAAASREATPPWQSTAAGPFVTSADVLRSAETPPTSSHHQQQHHSPVILKQERDLDLERVIDKVLEVESQSTAPSPVADSVHAQQHYVGEQYHQEKSAKMMPTHLSCSPWQPQPGGAFANVDIRPTEPSALIEYKPGYVHFSSSAGGGGGVSVVGGSPQSEANIFAAPSDWPYGGASSYLSDTARCLADAVQRPPSLAAHPDSMRTYSSPEQQQVPLLIPEPHSLSMSHLDRSPSVAVQHYLQQQQQHVASLTQSRRDSLASSTSSSHGGTPSPLEGQSISPFPQSSFRISSGLNVEASIHLAGSSIGMRDVFSPSAAEGDKVCAVCGDRAICMHYGAVTCEGCKGFFKRTVQKRAQYVCAGNKNCPIDKRYRSRCQYCRYHKCLAVGMVPDVVRSGTLTGRRGRLPSKTKGGHLSTPSTASSSPPSPQSIPIVALITNAFTEAQIQLKTECITSEYSTTASGSEQMDQLRGLQNFIELLNAEYQRVQLWTTHLPLVQDISSEYRESLIKINFFPVMMLLTAYRSIDCEDNALRFCNDHLLLLNDCPELWREWFVGVRHLADTFRSARTDLATVACLCSLMLVDSVPTSSAAVGAPLERVQTAMVNALKEQCVSQSLSLAGQLETKAPLRHLSMLALQSLARCVRLGCALPDRLTALFDDIDASPFDSQSAGTSK